MEKETLTADLLAQMKEKVLRRATALGQTNTAIAGFDLYRREEPNCCHAAMLTPSFGVIVQGRKQALIGATPYTYGAGQCILTGMNMPDTFSITEASHEQPFLAVSLNLDRRLLMQLTPTIPQPAAASTVSATAAANFHCVSVSTVEADTLHAMLRLLELLDAPEQIPVLAPLIIQEIHCRLLLSPLQYHKRLRLLEARRLMLTESMDATATADAVGYESVTQFNREYKRLFGEPPLRDIQRLLSAQERPTGN